MKLKLIMIFIFIITYGLFFYSNTTYKNQKIEIALDKQIELLKVHYSITKNQFFNNTETIKDFIKQNQQVQTIFEQAQNSNKEQRTILRNKLYNLLLPTYKRLKHMGILQFMFIFPNNITFLRMNKPSKFGDDVSKVRYSIKYVNETKKDIEGFEHGKTTHGFRYVFPYFSKNGKYLGAVEISLASYAIQNQLLTINKIHTHFLINKHIFETQEWQPDDMKQKYIPSIENKNYLFSLTTHIEKDHLQSITKKIILSVKNDILINMAKNKPFALYTPYQDQVKVIAFLPIKDTQKKIGAAYLVSYTDNDNIANICINYKRTNIIVFVILSFLFYFIYKTLIHKQNLKIKVEEKTNKLEETLIITKALLDSSHDGIVMIDQNNRCVLMNATGLKMYQIEDESKIFGINIFEKVTPDSIPIIQHNMANHYEKPYEIECLREDGTIYPALIKGKTITINNQNFRITSIIDLTERKNREKLLIEQSKMVAMGEMMESIVHQWKQPLSIITTLSTGIKMQQEYGLLTDEVLIDSCNNITHNAKYLSNTINDFKNFFKKDKVKEFFDIKEIYEQTLTLLKPKFTTQEITIISNVPSIPMNGFSSELIQVFINILNNARDELIKQDGLKLIFVDIKQQDNNINIEIKDNAGGIPKGLLTKIFNSYFTTKEAQDGTGIGLYMTKKIINESFKGTIEAMTVKYTYQNNNYTGAKFIINIPIS